MSIKYALCQHPFDLFIATVDATADHQQINIVTCASSDGTMLTLYPDMR